MTTRMMKGGVLLLTLACVLGSPEAAEAQEMDPEADEIRRVVTEGYVNGMHRNQGRDLVWEHFHPEFVMQVRGEEGVTSVTIQEWVDRLPPEGQGPDVEISHTIPTVMRTGNAAVAVVEMSRGGSHVFTDYISLYRFDDGWKMVAKIFHAHRGS